MNQQRFDELLKTFHQYCDDIVQAKRPAYTSQDADVLINFKNAARDAGTTPIQAWFVLFNKHISAISSFVKDPHCPQAEAMVGRFADAKNYIDLGYALFREAYENSTQAAVAQAMGETMKDTKSPSSGLTSNLIELQTLANPLMDWLRKNYDPHSKIILNSEHTELVQGQLGVPRNSTVGPSTRL